MEHRINFDVYGRTQNLKRMTRDQNTVNFLTVMTLATTFQHLSLFSMLEFVNVVHTNYFDRLMANLKWAPQARFDAIFDTMIFCVHIKGSYMIYTCTAMKENHMHTKGSYMIYTCTAMKENHMHTKGSYMIYTCTTMKENHMHGNAFYHIVLSYIAADFFAIAEWLYSWCMVSMLW